MILRRILVSLLLVLWFAQAVGSQTLDDPELKTSVAILYLRLGNYPECQRLTRELEAVGASTDGLDLLTGELALRPLLTLNGQGQYIRLLREAPALIERARTLQRPDREAQLRLLVLHAAYQSGHPGQVLEQTGPLLELTRNPDSTAEKLRRFTVLTYARRYAHLEQSPTPEQYRGDHDKVWALWKDIGPDLDYRRHSVAECELAAAACFIWWDEAFGILTYDQAYDMLFEDLERIDPVLSIADFEAELKRGAPLADLIRFHNLSEVVSYWRYLFLVFDSVAARFGPQDASHFASQNLPAAFSLLRTVEQSPDMSWLDPTLSSLDLVTGKFARLGALVYRCQAGQDLLASAPASRVDASLARAAAYAARSGDRFLADETELVEVAIQTGRRPLPPDLEERLRTLIARSEATGSFYVTLMANVQLGRLLYAQGTGRRCLEPFTRAISLFEQLFVQARLGPTAHLILSLYRPIYEEKARIEVELGLQHEAAETLDRLKQVGTALAFQTLQPRDPRSLAALQRADQAREQAEELRQSLAVAPEAERPQLTRQLALTRQDFYAALAEIQRIEPGYRRLQVRPNTFSHVQARLPDDTLLVQLFPSEGKLYLFLATHQELKIRAVDVSHQQINQWVADFRRSALRPSKNWLQDQALCQTMQSMSQALLEPLESDLAGKKVVAFIPTGTLCYLPMAALAHWREGEPTFLLEDAQVVTLMKASDLDLPSMSPPGKLSLLALGDPDGSLPGARKEVTALQSLVPGAEVFVGREATAERLQSSKARYLHLATHGMLNSQNPTASYLLLAPGEKQGSDWLLVSDIAGLRLENVAMVTLSACQTALAERSPEPGSDLQSLADAFGFAGSPSVVASLWKVEDEPTCQLMLKMYEVLAQGQPKGEALRQAQLALLRRPETSHPYFWAGFIFLGDWR